MKLTESRVCSYLDYSLGFLRCSSVSQPKQGEPLLTKAALVAAQATVVAVNQANREVTLEVPSKPGNTLVDVTASDDVKNLSQVRLGDRVTVEYIEAVFVDLFRAGEVEPGVNVTVAAATAPLGARPAAGKGIEKSVTAVDAPRSRFVAEFLGGANCLEGRCTPGDGIYEAGALRLAVPPDRMPGMEAPMVLCIKPEGVVLSAPGAPGTMPGIVVECDFLGFMTHLRVRLHDVTLRVSALSSESIRSLRSGSDVGVSVDWSKCSFLPGAVS